MKRYGKNHLTSNQFYQFYRHHRTAFPFNDFVSDYQFKRKANGLEKLHQEYLSALFMDRDDCHFRDYLHMTGNFELIPMIEFLNQNGVSMTCPPRSYFSFNKEEILGSAVPSADGLSYTQWKSLRHRNAL